jgi:glycerol-3-phosphate acyltransferase PlsY
MSKPSLALLSIPLGAYLLGSIPFGLLFTRLFGGGDVRKAGSGNIGATNVARVAGLVPAVLTLIFDFAKGAAPVWLAGRLTNQSATWMVSAALAAIVGHCFPIWLKGRGGKGVATAAGAFCVLSPAALLGSVILFLIVLFFWRYVSLASISAAAAMPLLIYILWAPGHAPPLSVTFGALAAAAIIIYKHDANIQRLVQGEEPKFSFGKKRATE